jgi:hypothetical protein
MEPLRDQGVSVLTISPIYNHNFKSQPKLVKFPKNISNTVLDFKILHSQLNKNPYKSAAKALKEIKIEKDHHSPLNMKNLIQEGMITSRKNQEVSATIDKDQIQQEPQILLPMIIEKQKMETIEKSQIQKEHSQILLPIKEKQNMERKLTQAIKFANLVEQLPRGIFEKVYNKRLQSTTTEQKLYEPPVDVK